MAASTLKGSHAYELYTVSSRLKRHALANFCPKSLAELKTPLAASCAAVSAASRSSLPAGSRLSHGDLMAYVKLDRMIAAGPDWALAALRDPRSLAALDLPQWSVFIRQAKLAGVLARVGAMLDELGLVGVVPPVVLGHIRAEQMSTAAQHDEVRQEIDAVRVALASVGVPLVLLKGAAYLAAQVPAARGRSFTDVDLLVPKERRGEVESALMKWGWMTTHHTAYDQLYYRKWMHELPPLRHVRRGSVLDVHHTILPETARLRPDPRLLLGSAQPVIGWDGVAVLTPMDMVLHSMTHLFYNDDMSHGLRDLSDLDLQLRHFAFEPDWWSSLVGRATTLDLRRPLYYGLDCARRILGTPVPDEVIQSLGAAAPGRLAGALMEALWDRALSSLHRSAADGWTPVALLLLYVRAHWLRMPPMLLARHLTIKAAMGIWPNRGEH